MKCFCLLDVQIEKLWSCLVAGRTNILEAFRCEGSALPFVVALTLWMGFGIDLSQRLFEKSVSRGRSDVETIESHGASGLP
jgi:hypothetical protein